MLLLVAAGLVCFSCDRPAESIAVPDRIFLVTIDTLRADHLGAYGYPRDTTPFLDSLAAQGVLFRSVQSQISHTAPSHASLFTGLEPPQHRLLANGQRLAPEVLSLAEVLKERGYSTAAFSGVAFLETLSAGFDVFSSSRRYGKVPAVLGRASRWLSEQPTDRRLFVWIHLFDVHEWKKDKRLSAKDLAWASADEPAGDLWQFLADSTGLAVTDEWNRETLLEWNDRYDSQIRWVDRELGSFFAEQNATHPDLKTAWIVTSDHGEGLGNHGTKAHGEEVYEEQLRVPLIFHYPAGGLSEGVSVDATVRLVDLGPTIADLAGASFDEQAIPVTGRSLRSLLEGGKEWHKPMNLAVRRPLDEKRVRRGWSLGDLYSLQVDNLKVIFRSAGAPEFYDLSADPFESINLFDDEQSAREGRRLLDAAERRLGELTDQGKGILEGEIEEEFRRELKALGYL